jgi:hypothetical protein
MRTTILLAVTLLCLITATSHADFSPVVDGKAECLIIAPPRVMEPDIKVESIRFPELEAEDQRRRLRESIRDLARCLEVISGAKVDIAVGQHETDPRKAIYIGEPAEKVWGPTGHSFPFKQAFRVVIQTHRAGLMGESDLATSYAIYEVLDRLGCRWFMPSDMGEVIPRRATVRLNECDDKLAPGTIYRGIWHVDEVFQRRNRTGGMPLHASHALDSYIKPAELEQHPDWVAVIKGKPSPPVIKWSKPEVADAMAAQMISWLDQRAWPSMSLSPEDGVNFEESEDPKIDAGGMDPILGMPRMTDRLLVLANRVAEKVTAKHPDAKFGMIAYINYTYPPVREPVHPAIVPVLAPITFSRNHPVTDEGEPNNAALRELIVEWGKKAKMTGNYYYGYNLAEVAAPNPMIHKWSVDVPFALQHGCMFFQPETDTNFETTMHAIYLGNRLAFDPKLDPRAIVRDINVNFYGEAENEASAYWAYVDECWYGTPEYSGAALGYMRRFPPDRVKRMRELMDAALAKATTEAVKARLTMADESLQQFEKYMQMRYDLADGRFDGLAERAKAWIEKEHALADQYRPQLAFTCRMYGKTPFRGSNNGVDFFAGWYQPAYADADRVAKSFAVLTAPPLRQWRYTQDKDKRGEELGYTKRDFDDQAWKRTDAAVDTWSTLGFHNYFGRVWYRADVALPPAAAGKKTYLWLAGNDGSVKVFVNGAHVPWTDAKGDKAEEFVGHMQPISFDITDALSSGDTAQITIRCDRLTPNEIGSGGIIGPALIYRDK